MKDADFRRAEFVYWSRRLVKEVVDQEVATHTRWRSSFSASPPHGLGISASKDRIDSSNEFALIRETTKYLREVTGGIDDLWEWEEYVSVEIELELGVVQVHSGWEGTRNEDIAVMRAVLPAPEGGSTLLALFGSARNYRKLNGNEGLLAEKPSDVDGLYGILDRVLEPEDPKVNGHHLDREIGHSAQSRAEAAEHLLDGPRFEAFRKGTFEALVKAFARVKNADTEYETIVLGTPMWVAEKRPRNHRSAPLAD